MKITPETKIKDLFCGFDLEIDHEYEPYELDILKKKITISVKRKQEKTFEWYVKEYITEKYSSISGSLMNRSFSKEGSFFLVLFDLKDYATIPFELKIGLLKFICDDFNIDLRVFIKFLGREMVKSIHDIYMVDEICPNDFFKLNILIIK